jgi:hypothetical protein
MTDQRYASYRQALQTIDHLPLRVSERDMLRDAAEGFLLAPAEDSWELAELGLGVSIVLDRTVSSRRLTRDVADCLAQAIEASGPQGTALLAA